MSFDDAPLPPLELDVAGSEPRAGATLQDVSWASTGGDRVTAWLVLPAPPGPRAGLLFQHWGFGDRASFLAEALALAPGGVASLLPDAPGYGARRGPRPLFRAPGPARAYALQALRDLRRGLDVLTSQPDVDAARLGFVGHSLGASLGGQLAGADFRVRAAVLLGGTGRISRLWQPRASPAEVEALADLDGVAWIGRARAAFLFQYAERDEWITRADAERLVAAAPAPKQCTWYPTDHAFDAEARRERAAWLAAQLGFAAPDPAALAKAALPARERRRYRSLKPLLALARLFARRA